MTDIQVGGERASTVFLFRPLTDRGRAWVEENVRLESWQWVGNAFAVEHRFAQELARAMIEDGLRVR